MSPYEDLKIATWQRRFSNQNIVKNDNDYRRIAEAIDKYIKRIDLRRSIHWHTVRNFFNDKGKPQPSTLDLLATYAAGASQLITFNQYQAGILTTDTLTPTLLPGGHGKWRVKVTLEVPIVLEFEQLPNGRLVGMQEE